VRVSDHRFAVQQTSRDDWETATAVNAAADFLAGYTAVINRFLGARLERGFCELQHFLATSPRDPIAAYVDANRHHSLLFAVLMMTGACNADCTICFTDRRKKPGELDVEGRDAYLRQARALGARYVYVPGEGEPTIDAGFWPLLDTCREIGMEAVIFTNGIVLSDEASCRRYWNMTPDEAVERLARYPVSLYFKLWSTQPSLVREMMRIPSHLYAHQELDGLAIPAGLVRLLRRAPRERVGIEIVVERRNADEVAEVLVPFAERHHLAQIVEVIQHNGRTLADGRFDPSEEQLRRVAGFLSPTSCSSATAKAVVTSRGLLSPRIAVLEDQIPAPAVHVASGPLFELLHSVPYLIERRFIIDRCLCEEMPAFIASARCATTPQTLRGPSNINPPTLEASA
jgi:hypothetical protein